MSITTIYKLQIIYISYKKIQALFGFAWVDEIILKLIQLNNGVRHFVLMCDSKYPDHL